MAAPARRTSRTSRTNRTNRNCGLTLIELMVALGMLAVLMTLAVPSFGSIMARQKLKAAAEDLAMDLAEMRFQATQRGTTMHLHFSSGPNWCYALALSSGCDCRVSQACQLKTVRSSDRPGVLLVDSEDAAFAPLDGQVGAHGHATLQTTDGTQRLRVTVGPLGRARLCALGPAVSGYPVC